MLHIFGIIISGLFFMLAGFTISKQFKKDEKWKHLIAPLLFLVWVLIVSGFFRNSELGGLAQKNGILEYYMYISLLSWNVFKKERKELNRLQKNNI